MSAHTSGIHHVTAIAGEPQRNVDFYVGVLGLHRSVGPPLAAVLRGGDQL